MAIFTVPILAGIAAAGGGFGLGSLLGKGKKDVSTEIHATKEHFAPVYGASTYAPVTAYAPQISQSYTGATYQIHSPGAVSKKETTVRQTGADIMQKPVFDIPTLGGQREEKGAVSGMNVEMIAIIAVVGAVVITGIGALGKKK